MPRQSDAPPQQQGPHTEPSRVIASPALDDDAFIPWTDEDFAQAVPEPPPTPTQPPSVPGSRQAVDTWPQTFVPPHIGGTPYNAMCKLFYRRSGLPYVASAWIVLGNTGRKGILTAGHVVYLNGVWSKDYVVCREYTGGLWIEQFRGNFARTLNGWIHGQGVREFWDLGAVIPFTPVPHTTPALPVTFGYNPQIAPFNFFYDVGYPAKPANGYPFDGQFQWESDGPLITVHHHNDQFVLQAYNAMEHGSSGSPWMIYDAIHNIHYAAGIQSSGWDGIPSSYSPYFDQRNIVPLLRDIDVLE